MVNFPPIKTLCVYCGSRPGQNELYQASAVELGASLAEYGIDLVYGGGTKGLMGKVAKALQEKGGKVTGIIPHFLMDKEATAPELQQLDELIITENMHQRKYAMFERADGFITLPGGIGTLEELVEMMTWAQLERHKKPIILVNINNFWQPLLKLFDHMSCEGFFHNSDKTPLLIANDIKDIFTILKLKKIKP